jgi:hypothetical protein
MVSKIMLFSLDCEDAALEVIEKVDNLTRDRYVVLQVRLKEFDVVEFAFDSWDVESKFCIKMKLEGMISVDPMVHVI